MVSNIELRTMPAAICLATKGQEQGDMIDLGPVFILLYGLHGREVLTLHRADERLIEGAR